MGGGMIVGTILTLGLVPILYALFFRVGRAQIAVGAGREILATRRTGVFRRALKV
jgi:hypothetical protein